MSEWVSVRVRMSAMAASMPASAPQGFHFFTPPSQKTYSVSDEKDLGPMLEHITAQSMINRAEVDESWISIAAAPDFANYAYLHEEVARRLMDRLDDIHESYEFVDAVDLSCGPGHVRRALGGRGVQRLAVRSTRAVPQRCAATACGDGVRRLRRAQCGDRQSVTWAYSSNAALIAVFSQQLRDICARTTRCASLSDA